MNKEINSLLIYTTSDFPYGMAPESLVRQMALGFQKHNIKLKVIRLRGLQYNYKNDTSIESTNFVLPRLPEKEILKFIEFFTFLFLIPFSVIKNKIKYKSDAVMLYGVEYFYLIFPYWIACRLTNTKLIRFTTDFYRESSIVPVWWKKPKLFFYLFQFKHFDKYLDGIVSLSRFMADFAIKNGVKPEKVIVIPHFIDTEGFCKGLSKNNFQGITRIGFCGTANKSNGIYDLIEAFKHVHKLFTDTELLIIGEPSPEDRALILEATSSFGGFIKITGLLTMSEVPAALLQCNILVNPRISGKFAEAGFPTKLGEYFSTGLPVITTTVADFKHYFINKHELMLVQPDNPAEIADAIIFLINNKEKANEIGKAGLEWAKLNLDFKQNTAKLLRFINGL